MKRSTVVEAIQVNVVTGDDGKQHIKCVVLPEPPTDRVATEISFGVYKMGNPARPGAIIPVVDGGSYLSITLYWTSDTFEQKDLVDKVTLRLHSHIKQLIAHDPSWKAFLAETFQGSDWEFRDFYTLAR